MERVTILLSHSLFFLVIVLVASTNAALSQSRGFLAKTWSHKVPVGSLIKDDASAITSNPDVQIGHELWDHNYQLNNIDNAYHHHYDSPSQFFGQEGHYSQAAPDFYYHQVPETPANLEPHSVPPSPSTPGEVQPIYHGLGSVEEKADFVHGHDVEELMKAQETGLASSPDSSSRDLFIPTPAHSDHITQPTRASPVWEDEEMTPEEAQSFVSGLLLDEPAPLDPLHPSGKPADAIFPPGGKGAGRWGKRPLDDHADPQPLESHLQGPPKRQKTGGEETSIPNTRKKFDVNSFRGISPEVIRNEILKSHKITMDKWLAYLHKKYPGVTIP